MASVEEIQTMLSQKDELARVRENKSLLKAEYPCLFFVPNEVQVSALKMLDKGIKDGIRSFGVLPGNGIGKTTLLINLIWNIATGPQSQHFEYDFIKHWPYRKELRLTCDAADIKEVSGGLWQAIDMWWPKKHYKTSMQGYDYWASFTLPKGFSLSIRTYNQPRRLHESVSLGAVFLNEPPDNPGIWQQYGARLRGSGFRAVFGTVWEDDSLWIQEEIVDNPRARYCFGDIEECCSDHHENGHFTHKEIEGMIADYPDDQREARRTGQFRGLTQHPFKIDDKHDCELDEVPEDSTAYSALDPHPLRPWVYLVGRIDEHGDWWIVDEWPHEVYHKMTSDLRGLAEYAKIIKGMDDDNGIVKRVIDAAGSGQNIRKDYGSTTVRLDLLKTFGLRFEDGNRHVGKSDGPETDGVPYVRTMLLAHRIHICRHCRNLRFQLENLSKKKNTQTGKYLDELDTKYLDFPRALMYLVMAGFKHRPGADPEKLRTARMTAHEKELIKIRRMRDEMMPTTQGHPATPVQWNNC